MEKPVEKPALALAFNAVAFALVACAARGRQARVANVAVRARWERRAGRREAALLALKHVSNVRGSEEVLAPVKAQAPGSAEEVALLVVRYVATGPGTE